MLAFFKVVRNFHKLRVSIYVDNVLNEAEILVNYDRLVVRKENIPFRDVDTPEKAEAWLSRPTGDYHTLVEFLEAQCRAGLLTSAT